MCELEGVLVDTHPQRRSAMQRSFAEEGIVLPDSIYITHCAGRPVEAAVEAALGAIDLQNDGSLAALLALRTERHFADLAARGVMLAPGAGEFIERAAATTRLALVTRATRRETELVLSLAGLDAAFECVMSAEDAAAPKPSGAVYAAAIERLARLRAVERDRVIALDDSPDGVGAAHEAGVRCILVDARPGRRSAGADGVLSTIAGQSPASLEALVAGRAEAAA